LFIGMTGVALYEIERVPVLIDDDIAEDST
jgi:hypothetical protein